MNRRKLTPLPSRFCSRAIPSLKTEAKLAGRNRSYRTMCVRTMTMVLRKAVLNRVGETDTMRRLMFIRINSEASDNSDD
jgi:hypothetical protein